jgi:glycosyltransferase involved in cell wall biosynthesis
MKTVQFIGSVSVESAGPTYSVRRLSQELCALGCEVHVVALAENGAERQRDRWAPVAVHLVAPRGPRRFGYSAGWFRMLEVIRPDLVHGHGLWMYHSLVSLRWCRGCRPRIVSPHGMLEPWAFGYRRWKKLPVWLLWEKRGLESSVLHATSEQEAINIRALGLRAPIAVIPNGIDLPELPLSRGAVNAERRALFLSRIHPIKGLLNLVEAWRRVRPPGWRLCIAGPDECGHLNVVQRAVREAGLAGVVDFVGPVYGKEKQELLNTADLFILPTFSENFGVVVGEALASGVPVITTKGAPWSWLLSHRCGWWVDIGVEPLAEAISEATQCTASELHAMGEHGRRLVEGRFSWPKIAQQMKTVYEWVLGGGPRPECVETG